MTPNRLRIVRPQPKADPKPGTWGRLAEPVFPDDTRLLSQFQSETGIDPGGLSKPQRATLCDWLRRSGEPQKPDVGPLRLFLSKFTG